jgi:hypothetical protein
VAIKAVLSALALGERPYHDGNAARFADSPSSPIALYNPRHLLKRVEVVALVRVDDGVLGVLENRGGLGDLGHGAFHGFLHSLVRRLAVYEVDVVCVSLSVQPSLDHAPL